MSVYVVVTEAACEKRAMQWLLEHEVAAYTPIVRRWRYAMGRRVKNDRPLFPRLLFVASNDVDPDDDGRPGADFVAAGRCRYVTGWLGSAGRPRPITAPMLGCRLGKGRIGEGGIGDDWLMSLIVMQWLGLFDHTRGRKPQWTVGQLVRIIGGAFKGLGYEGSISELREGGRLVVIPKVGGKLNLGADQVELVA